MKGITLRHPWAFAVAFLQKDCENRDWSNELANLNRIHDQLGQQIAIHGGAAPMRPKGKKHWTQLADSNLWRQHCEALEHLRGNYFDGLTQAGADYLHQTANGGPLTPEHFILPGIVAVATVERITRASQSRWAVPWQLHIELSEVIALPSPVGCPGAQGLWTLPEAIEEAVRHELTRWSVAQVPVDSGRDGGAWLQ